MDRLDLQKLRDLPIEGVAERLGLRVKRHMSLCPFHDDHHASLSFKVSRNTFRCFVCGASGGTIDLVMHFLHVDFKEACRWLADGSWLTVNGSGFDKPQTSDISRQTSFDASRYERFFQRPFLNEEARRFLFEERRLDERVVRWCRLTSWRDKQGVPWLQTPYYDREGRLVGVQNRNLVFGSGLMVHGSGLMVHGSGLMVQGSGLMVQGSGLMVQGSGEMVQGSGEMVHGSGEMVHGSGEMVHGSGLGPQQSAAPRFRFPAGSCCTIYNLPVLNLLKPGDELYITEGCSDCWAMLSAGHKAIAIPSATLLKRKDVELLQQLDSSPNQGRSGGVSFHMFPDRDEPGERLFLQLKERLPNLVHHQLPPGCKDFSDYYLSTK